jgi:capsular exopolysaccharide synthesis family protein
MESQELVYVSFGQYSQIIKRRWAPALGMFVAVSLTVMLASSLKKPLYVAEGKLLFQRTNKISSLTGMGSNVGTLEPLVQDNKTSPLNTESEVIRSVPVVQKTIAKMRLKDEKGKTLKYKDFLKQLSVKNIDGSDVLGVTYKDVSPERAAEVVNTLIQVYLEHNISFHRSEIGAARKFIENQLPTAELFVRKAEAELRRFKEKNQVIALGTEATQGVQSIGDLQQKIGETQSKIADVTAQSQVISKQLGMDSSQAITMTSLNQSRGVQDVLTQIQQLESQIATRSSVLRNNHPEMMRLQNNLTILQEIMRKRIKQVAGSGKSQNQNLQTGQLQQQLAAKLVDLESTSQGLSNQLVALSSLESNYKQRLKVIPKLEQQQRELERQLEAAQSTYSQLLQKLQESRITENQNLGNARNFSPAIVPDQPVSSPVIAFLSAGLLGILAALATALILEKADKSIRTMDDVRELLGFTILGVIPSFTKEQKLIFGSEESQYAHQRLMVNYAPRSPISEAYRMLRANLTFVSTDKQLKVIVVSSSVPQEGKSTVSANLALLMAQMERKVLLVDADLRRPVQHHIWELPNTQGLSHVIVGQANVRGAIAKVSDNLDVLSAGVVPPSPASLLDSKRMATLIQDFAIDYDFVIIDTPALTVAADAAILGQMADGILFVVRPGVADTVNATIARELLQQSGQNVLGQVVNGVISQNESHNYYYGESGNEQENVLGVVGSRLDDLSPKGSRSNNIQS